MPATYADKRNTLATLDAMREETLEGWFESFNDMFDEMTTEQTSYVTANQGELFFDFARDIRGLFADVHCEEVE